MKLIEIFKALAHDKRMTILSLLKDRCRTAKELSELLNMDKGAINKHLRKLQKAGLVKIIGERDGENLYDLSSVKVYRLLVKGSELLPPKSFESVKGDKILDLRGEICPVPLIEVEKAFKEAKSGETFEVWLDYPLSAERIVSKYFNNIVLKQDAHGFTRIVIRK